MNEERATVFGELIFEDIETSHRYLKWLMTYTEALTKDCIDITMILKKYADVVNATSAISVTTKELSDIAAQLKVEACKPTIKPKVEDQMEEVSI